MLLWAILACGISIYLFIVFLRYEGLLIDPRGEFELCLLCSVKKSSPPGTPRPDRVHDFHATELFTAQQQPWKTRRSALR